MQFVLIYYTMQNSWQIICEEELEDTKRSNQNPKAAEEQITQWPKAKGQNASIGVPDIL